GKVKFGAHGQILLQNSALKNSEAFVRIRRQPQVHPSFEIFQLRASIQNSIKRNLQARFKEKGQIGQGREVVNPPHPLGRAAANRIARIGGKNITVAKHEITSAQQWNQVALVAIGKIGRMNQAERRWRKQFPLFAFARGGLDDLRGVPLTEINLVPLQFEPAFEQINLG